MCICESLKAYESLPTIPYHQKHRANHFRQKFPKPLFFASDHFRHRSPCTIHCVLAKDPTMSKFSDTPNRSFSALTLYKLRLAQKLTSRTKNTRRRFSSIKSNRKFSNETDPGRTDHSSVVKPICTLARYFKCPRRRPSKPRPIEIFALKLPLSTVESTTFWTGV